jgi:8-oxo-dGTP diphosphatase
VLERGGRILLVASRYPNHSALIWNLPGGRQEHDELRDDTVIREFLEETGLRVRVEHLLYVSESFDRAGAMHVTNTTFAVRGDGEPKIAAHDAHAVELGWFTREELAQKLHIAVVREPLLAYLGGDRTRYYGFREAGVTIEFAD